MSNLNVRIVGTANTTQMTGAFGQVEAQVAALNARLAQMVNLQNGVDARGMKNMARAAATNDAAWRNAVDSTGMFHREQMRVNSATDDYVKKLKARKLSFRDMMRDQKTAAAAYREQISLEKSLMLRQSVGSSNRGRTAYDITYGKAVAASANTAGMRVAWLNEQIASGSKQMINWGKNTQWAGRQLMVGFTLPIAAAGAAAGMLAYQVDKELTRVAKVYDTTADSNSSSLKEQMQVTKELNELRIDGLKTATTAAREYGVAATDALQVQADLAATGKTGVDLQSSTKEVLRVARLGEVDYEIATQAGITLQAVFRDTIKTSEDLADAFNYMNSVENATSLETKDFAEAIPIAAAPVKAFGGDVEELGILLTAMKERGIQATQGANALKAAMQRLGRPSKQVQQEFTELTGQDITKIFDQSEGMIDLFTRIGDATKDLTDKEQIKAFSGLFGTYQVTRMSALVSGMEDLRNGVGQVSDAYRISEGTSEEWASTAEMEMKRYQESISGQFDTTLEEMKIKLGTFGEPFVQVATIILKGVIKIMDAFNAMPNIAKWTAALAVGFVAIAGPLVMLTGLFANLFGNILSTSSSFASLFVRMGILDKESRVAKAASDLVASGFQTQKTATMQLTAELEKLALAQAEANRLTLAANPNLKPSIVGAATTNVRDAASHAARAEQKTAPAIGAVHNQPSLPTKQYHGALVVDTARFETAKKLGKEQRNQLRTQSKANELSKGQEGSTKKSASHMANFGTGAAVASASMATMMLTSNETANSIAQYALVATMVVPAAKALVPLMAKSAKWAIVQAAALSTGGKAMAGKGIKGAMSSIGGMMTKTNIAVAGVLAVGYGLWKINDMQKKAAAAHLKTQKEINASAENYAEAVGLARREWGGIQTFAKTMPSYDKYEEARKHYDESETGQQDVKNFEAMDSEAERLNYIKQQYAELITTFKISSEDATASVAALYAAGSGESATESMRIAEGIAANLGDIKNFDWKASMNDAREGFDHAMNVHEVSGWLKPDDFRDLAEEEGGKIGDVFFKAISAADGPGESSEVFSYLEDAALKSWSSVNDFIANSNAGEQWKELLKQQGIDSVKELSQWWRSQSTSEITQAFTSAGFGPGAVGTFEDLFENANSAESAIIQAAAATLNLGKDITTVWELASNWEFAPLILNYEGTIQESRRLVQELIKPNGVFGVIEAMNNPQKFNLANLTEQEIRDFIDAASPEELQEITDKINALATAKNIKVAPTLFGTYINILNKVKNDTDDVTNATARMANAWRMAAGEAAEIQKAGMEGVQQDIADEISKNFESSMDASIDARETMWEKRREGQQAAFEREERALEKKWEDKTDAAEKYWDSRIQKIEDASEAEQKAEEKRQEMFNKEMERIRRLNDAMNTNIDFNSALNEGDFDAAAKIRNDVSATANTNALQDAADQGTKGYDKRIAALDEEREKTEKSRDEYMDNLSDREDAEKRHLDKTQKMREDALANESESNMEALRNDWENRRDHLDSRITLFKAFTARNEKELRQHMQDVGLSYKDFGKDLKDKGSDWSTFIGESLKKHIREAGMKMKDSKVWEAMGKQANKDILNGMGFANQAEFRYFIKHGKMKESKTPTDGYKRTFEYGATGESRHEGGVVGSGMGSRKGVARTSRGLHHSEAMIRAQKGEFVVNRKSAGQHADLLNDINNGRITKDSSRRNKSIGFGGPGEGMAMMLGAIAARGMALGVGKGMENAYEASKQKSLGSKILSVGGIHRGGFKDGTGGWSKPSVPGKGWTNSHDYGNGIGSPLYAYNNGVVIESRAITSGGSPGNGKYSTPYTSYGEVVKIRGNDGNVVTYAHLSPGKRFVQAGDTVKGGALIGLSGETGNAWGAHTHFDINGANIAREWFASRGIPLKTGGTIKNDGTAAILHKNERVLTAPLTKKLDEGIDNIHKASKSNFKYPEMGTGMADSPHTWFDTEAIKGTSGASNNSSSAAKASLKIGTLNTWVKTDAKATISDLERMITGTDFIALTEMGNKYKQVSTWLNKQNWGTVGGGNRDQSMSIMAYNKATQKLDKAGQKKLGDKRANVVGGRETRYANYGKFTDRESGRSTWQVAAHTVPAGRGLNAKNGPLFREQWGNLDALVNKLGASAPVFVSGDLNVHKSQKAFRTPGGLNEFSNLGVNYTFGNKKMSSLINSKKIGGLHTDHKGGLMSNFSLPQMKVGGTVRMDNTLANLHKGERVLTAPLSKKLDIGLNNLASGGDSTYNVEVNVAGTNASPNEIAEVVITKLQRLESRKPKGRQS